MEYDTIKPLLQKTGKNYDLVRKCYYCINNDIKPYNIFYHLLKEFMIHNNAFPVLLLSLQPSQNALVLKVSYEKL